MCDKVNMSTPHPDGNNVIAYGKVQPSWFNGEHQRSGILRKRRETDYFYLTFNFATDLDPYKIVSIQSTNTALAYTLFKVDRNPISETSAIKASYLISTIYECNPLIQTTLTIELLVKLPGCPPMVMIWSKMCGNTLAPIPGLEAFITSVYTKSLHKERFINQGLFDFDRSKPEFLDPSNHNGNTIVLDDHRVQLDFKIMGVPPSVIEFAYGDQLELPGTPRKTRDQIAAQYNTRQFDQPKLHFDESIGDIEVVGRMLDGGAFLNYTETSMIIDVMKCKKNANLLFEVDIPIAHKSVNFILSYKCTVGLGVWNWAKGVVLFLWRVLKFLLVVAAVYLLVGVFCVYPSATISRNFD